MALDASKQCYDAPCHLSPAAIEELEWWKNHLTAWNGKSLVLRQPDLRIESDASLIGWGASCQGTQMGGPWSQQAHKRPGAACSYTSGEDILKRSRKQESTAAAGQSDSSCLYKQPGRNSLRPRHKAGKRFVDVVLTERHPIDSTIPTREGECEGRHGVESDEGSLRLDAEPATDSEPLPLSGGRPVRDTTDLPATSLLQL